MSISRTRGWRHSWIVQIEGYYACHFKDVNLCFLYLICDIGWSFFVWIGLCIKSTIVIIFHGIVILIGPDEKYVALLQLRTVVCVKLCSERRVQWVNIVSKFKTQVMTWNLFWSVGNAAITSPWHHKLLSRHVCHIYTYLLHGAESFLRS